jgi:anti-anti-sigma factor
MTAKPFEAGVRRKGGAAVVDLLGEIDGFAREALNGAYAEAEKGDPEAVLLNFEDVGYVDSTGVALIVGLLARARLQAAPPGLRPLRALRGDLGHHPPLGLRGRLSGRRERPDRNSKELTNQKGG